MMVGFFILLMFLIGCTSISSDGDPLNPLGSIGSSASGSLSAAVKQIQNVMTLGTSATDGVMHMVEDAKHRFTLVQSGVDLLLRAKVMINSGVSGIRD